MPEDNNDFQDENNIEDENYTTRISGLLEDLDLAKQKALEQQDTDIPLEAIIPWVIEFRVIGTPEIIRAPLSDRLTIGREDAKNNIYPEIDLLPHHGQRLGVSRKHARIIMRDNRMTVEDLGSANGTYINGMNIGVLLPTRLRDGDQLKLGNLSLQVHFIVQPYANDDTMHGIGNNMNIPKIANGERLLILDDNKEVCAVLRMIAIQAGFTVSVAHDTAMAVSAWDNDSIDAIIVELMLEDSNGLDLVDYVRQNKTVRTPIIATTSTIGGYRENQARAKGVDDLLEKPLSVDKIIETLGRFTEMLPE
ncbi:MAG: hypothetical protein Phog2KO_37570 [Phototrophicaceae bacterium]